MDCDCGTQIKQLIYEDEDEEPFIFCPGCINPKLIESFRDLGEIKDYNPEQEEETTDRSNLQQNTTDSSEEQQTVVSSDDNNESSSADSEEDEDGFIFGG